MSDSDTDGNGQLDPDVVEELEDLPREDPFVTEYSARGEGSDEESISFAAKWFPDESDWQGKTSITQDQAHALAAVRNLSQAFEELEPLEGMLNDMVDDYEMYLTSVDGVAREQQVQVLMSMLGGGVDGESVAGNTLARLFAQNPEGDGDE